MDVVKGAFPMSNSENTTTIEVAAATAPEATGKATRAPHSARCAAEGRVNEEGHLEQESAKKPKGRETGQGPQDAQDR
jgi:hypothetical protein